MRNNSKLNYFLELLVLFSSLFLVILLLVVLFYSLVYWNSQYSFIRSLPFPDQMWSLGMLITIVTVLGEWIAGRIKAIINSFKTLGGKNGEGRSSIKS